MVVGVEADKEDACVCQRTQAKRGEKEKKIGCEEPKKVDNKGSLVVNFGQYKDHMHQEENQQRIAPPRVYTPLYSFSASTQAAS